MSSPRGMIACPKMSQNEWKATEIRASNVGHVSPFSYPGRELVTARWREKNDRDVAEAAATLDRRLHAQRAAARAKGISVLDERHDETKAAAQADYDKWKARHRLRGGHLASLYGGNSSAHALGVDDDVGSSVGSIAPSIGSHASSTVSTASNRSHKTLNGPPRGVGGVKARDLPPVIQRHVHLANKRKDTGADQAHILDVICEHSMVEYNRTRGENRDRAKHHSGLAAPPAAPEASHRAELIHSGLHYAPESVLA